MHKKSYVESLEDSTSEKLQKYITQKIVLRRERFCTKIFNEIKAQFLSSEDFCLSRELSTYNYEQHMFILIISLHFLYITG